MNDTVPTMSTKNADILFGRQFAEDIESSFFHDKLLDTLFDPSLERLAGVTALLQEQEAAVLVFDTTVATVDAMVRAEIAAIADPSLFVLDEVQA